MRPETLREVGFHNCEHPLFEVRPYLDHSQSRFCLTCGATMATREGWRRGAFGMHHGINYNLLERYGLTAAFEFWIAQRPVSRAFGDVS